MCGSENHVTYWPLRTSTSNRLHPLSVGFEDVERNSSSTCASKHCVSVCHFPRFIAHPTHANNPMYSTGPFVRTSHLRACIFLRVHVLSLLAFWVSLQLVSVWSFIGPSLYVHARILSFRFRLSDNRIQIYIISPSQKTGYLPNASSVQCIF